MADSEEAVAAGTDGSAALTGRVPAEAITQPQTERSDLPSSSATTDHVGVSQSQPIAPETPSSPSSDVPATSTPAVPSPSPARRRPKPPTKGILKPPPPPAKPTLGNRLRDLASNVVSGSSKLFDSEEPSSSRTPTTNPAGPSAPPSVSAAVGGTLNALSGRLGLGLSRFVAGSSTPSPGPSPVGSPVPSRTGLPDTISPQPMSEKSRQKQPLKRATFVLPSLSITYPISSQGEPWSVKVIEDRKRIESMHRSLLSTSTGADYWTSQRLVALYENACRGREERPRVGIVRALEVTPPPPRARHIHLILRPSDSSAPPTSHPSSIDFPLNRHAAEAFADVLTSEWGLSELKLENGIIETEDALKPILHALLVSGTLPSLSLAGNKKIKAGGWRLLAVFLKRARSLRYIDLSDTSWDKKGVEYLVQAMTCSQIRPPPATIESEVSSTEDTKQASNLPDAHEVVEEGGEDAYGAFIPPAPLLKEQDVPSTPASVQTLRMDGCGLKPAILETLGQGIRSSEVKNISLRRNRIGPLGAVSLALMIRDYPDSSITMSSLSPALTSTPSIHNPTIQTIDSTSSASYVPNAARSRRPNAEALAAAAAAKDDEASLPPIPLVVSSAAGGITSRTVPDGYKPPPPPKNPLVMPPGGNSAMQDGASFGVVINGTQVEGKIVGAGDGASVALQRSVRALDGVERIGRLLTLDLKGNEIKNGVGYIAQVLKRNRTLKVLNLSDNKIEAPGLTAIAEALKYNSSLETLDMSSNLCCGPSQEGIAALRTTFTVNTSLKRLFLSDTGLTSEGAIALAEFLPETKSLLHLDLTSNPLETAGILAISVGLKANKLIRCLDVSIPPNNPDLAELSQSILQSCIHNTELAASALSGKAGSQEAIWGPIKKSTLVKQVKDAEHARAEKERLDLAQSPEGVAREYAYTLKPERVVSVSEQVARNLEKWFDAGLIAKKPSFHAWEPGQLPKDDFLPLMEKAKALKERIVDLVQEPTDDETLEKLLGLNDTFATLLDKAMGYSPPPRLLLPSQIVPTEPRSSPSRNLGPGQPHAHTSTPRHATRRHMRTTSLEISSPNFSIGDSDGESDAEELDVGRLPSTPHLPSPPRTPRLTSHGEFARDTSPSIGNSGGEGRVGMSTGFDVEQEHVSSPVEKVGRAWIEEEGEIFRKGTKLGVAEEEEVEEHKDVSGEELKQEILETEVARSPTRRVIQVEEEEESEVHD